MLTLTLKRFAASMIIKRLRSVIYLVKNKERNNLELAMKEVDGTTSFIIVPRFRPRKGRKVLVWSKSHVFYARLNHIPDVIWEGIHDDRGRRGYESDCVLEPARKSPCRCYFEIWAWRQGNVFSFFSLHGQIKWLAVWWFV